ncbi:MAG TPA: tetratricopeptide repeat protein [Bryobacteraceae bacterium]|jgi:tetratricopeptide (TPR) repeat protein
MVAANPGKQNSQGDGIEDLRKLAQALAGQERYEEALPVYEALLAADRPGVQTQEALARCLERLGRWGEAVARYRLVLDVDPDRPDTLAALGLCMVRLDTPLAAVTAFDRCLRLNPAHVGALLGKATCLRLTGDAAGAEKMYREAILVQPEIESALEALIGAPAKPFEPKPPKGASEVAELENIIANAILAEDYITAARHCRALLELEPDYYEAWFNLGVFEQSNSNLEAAAEAFLGAARLQPLNVEPLQALAQAYHLLGDLKAAESSYQAALSIDADSVHLLWNLGLVLEQRKDLEGAAQKYSRIVKSDPDRGEAWFRLGFLRLRLDELEGAVVALRRARDLRATTLESNYNLGVAYWRLGRVSQASECFHSALSMQPGFMPAHRGLAAAALLAADYSLARGLLRELTERGDTSAEVLFNLAVLEHRENRFHSAIEFYKQALKIDPDLTDASAGLALAQSMLSARRYN